MLQETLAIVYALASALAWGSGDFVGGYLSRQISTYKVIFAFELSGGIALTLLAIFSGEPFPAGADLLFGAAAGAAGIVGLYFLYQGLASYQMGLIAPLSAVITGLVPVGFGFALDGLPGVGQLLGMGLALAAVWWIAGGEQGAGTLRSLGFAMLKFPLFAGFGFGCFFVLMDQIQPGAVYWPIVSARAAAFVLVALWLLFRPKENKTSVQTRGVGFQLLIVLGGVLDTAGNVFFVLAAQAGRLDISSVLSSLFPAATVFLAWMFLRERLTRRQLAGVFAAVVSVALITS